MNKMTIRHKWVLCLMLAIFSQSCFSVSELTPYDVKVFIERSGASFQILASYVVPASECEAHVFLTDYEGAKNIPGIKESKILERTGNRVQVERIAEEKVLFFLVTLHSILEFIEVSENRLEFKQTEGDAKSYKGNWVIKPDKNGTRLTHQAFFELETSIPLFLIKYFLENSATKRFEIMAERLSQQKPNLTAACNKTTFM